MEVPCAEMSSDILSGLRNMPGTEGSGYWYHVGGIDVLSSERQGVLVWSDKCRAG